MMNSAALGIAPPEIYAIILNALLPIQGTRILEVPCGSGLFAQHLATRGAECVAVDIVPTYAYSPMVVADMNLVLPFIDESFDIVISVEGIEHIHNTFHLLHEYYRILKPGGALILSTPNLQNIRSRIKFFLRGTLYWFDPYETTNIGHVNIVPYFLLKHILRESGFSEISVQTSRNTFPCLPAFLCRLMQRWFSKSNEDDIEQNSPTIVNAENLIVSAKKPTN
jgi:ubiquinone/menaquinone biosynthesis C-methylase UbiE